MLGAFQLRQEILELCNAAISDDLPKDQPTRKPALEQARQPVPKIRDDVFDKTLHKVEEFKHGAHRRRPVRESLLSLETIYFFGDRVVCRDCVEIYRLVDCVPCEVLTERLLFRYGGEESDRL